MFLAFETCYLMKVSIGTVLRSIPGRNDPQDMLSTARLVYKSTEGKPYFSVSYS